MKHATIKATADMLEKIESIEKELMNLKLSALKSLSPTHKKTNSLRGILKGVQITDADILSAKKSLYSKVDIGV